ncbi:hypothetical protein EJ077_07170 [Mesorhizobium sp. M8A.F.Ca.ET.057.01.1.1]|uniref:hypothetical protein n=1 Tax=Mesorhizobium sp. M8A.F.Ca.ET.057.01.1.1 TaxID=2493679 RepID=UPI000F75DA8C|nr:hypothetical protein [Mesorhizobium sp. M8A.F.Ca.ET.057.01.1.1]AZO53314.1 hypothetical protein EJ077_07170 [Mesorhizobium sp. M8A.F.Ca.ET.057.01.1.1]
MANEPYPYLVHTNRELEMMLAGSKPFAVFAHERVDGFEKSDALANQDFATYVANGTVSEHIRSFTRHLPDGSSLDIDYYFYSRRGEEWRVEAFLLLLDLMGRGPGALNWNGWKASFWATRMSRTFIISPEPIRKIDGSQRHLGNKRHPSQSSSLKR